MKKRTNLLTREEVDNYARMYGNEFVVRLLINEEYFLSYRDEVLEKAVIEAKEEKNKLIG